MTPDDPTTQIESFVEPDVTQQLRERLATLDKESLADWIDSLPPGEIARAVAHLSFEECTRLLHTLDPEDAADLIDDLPDEQSADLLEEMPTEEAADIVEELDSDDRADVLGEMEEEKQEAILGAMAQEEAKEARELMAYPGDTAGGVMVTEFVAYPTGTTVEQVLKDLQQNRETYSDYDVRYFYVTDSTGVLKGVLRLRDMVLSAPSRPIDEFMIRTPAVVHADLDLNTLQRMFEIHSYSALPVTDEAGRLLGVAIEKEVAEAARKNANRVMLKLVGIFGGEELRSMPTMSRIGRRLSWLIVILVLNLCAASVIALYMDTLQQMIALAVFLPVVAGMSGSSGNQAVGLSLRELALGVVKPWDMLYVLFKEMRVGLVNGVVLGILLGVICSVWKDYTFGLVVGVALSINTFMAVCLGGLMPLLLKRMKLDPAMASSPIITMVSDAGGFFLVLNFAALLL